MVSVILLSTGLALAFLLHSMVVGSALLRCFSFPEKESRQRDTDWAWFGFFGVSLGMWVNMAGLFVLGMLGHFHLAAVSFLALVLFVAGTVVLWRRPWRGRAGVASPTRTGSYYLQLATLAVVFLMTMMATLHPPGHWDDTMYHLPLSRYYMEEGRIVLQEYLRFPLFPQNFNLLFAFGMMLGEWLTPQPTSLWQFGAQELFAQVFASLPLFVMAVGLWAASHRYMGSGLPGLLAGLTMYALQPIKSTLGFAYIDDGLAMFCLAAALAVAWAAESVPGKHTAHRAREPLESESVGRTLSADPKWRANALFVLAGLLAGAACGTKYFGVVFSAVLGAVVLAVAAFRVLRTPGGTGFAAMSAALYAGLAYSAGVLLAGSWWYIRSFLISGDPIHPAGAPVFGFFLWNELDLLLQRMEQATHGVGSNPLKLPLALFEAEVQLWLLAVAGLLLRGLSPAIRVLQAVFIFYLLFWFFVTQVERYLAPVYGVAGLLSFHMLQQIWLWWKRRKAGETPEETQTFAASQASYERPWVYMLLLGIAVVYAAERGVKHGSRFLEAEAVLNANAGYALYQEANLHRDELGSRLVQVQFEKGFYFFRGTVIGDWFGPGRYTDILECPALPCPLPPPQNLLKTLQKHNARMLLLSREAVDGMNKDTLTAAGWRLLASDERGVLLASP